MPPCTVVLWATAGPETEERDPRVERVEAMGGEGRHLPVVVVLPLEGRGPRTRGQPSDQHLLLRWGERHRCAQHRPGRPDKKPPPLWPPPRQWRQRCFRVFSLPLEAAVQVGEEAVLLVQGGDAESDRASRLTSQEGEEGDGLRSLLLMTI